MAPERFEWTPADRSTWGESLSHVGWITAPMWIPILDSVRRGTLPSPLLLTLNTLIVAAFVAWSRRPPRPRYELLADDAGLLLRPPEPLPFWRRPLFGTDPDGWRLAWEEIARARLEGAWLELAPRAPGEEPRRLALAAPAWGRMQASDRLLALLTEKGLPVEAA